MAADIFNDKTTVTIPNLLFAIILVALVWFVIGTLLSRYVWMPFALRVWGRNPMGGAPYLWMFRVGFALGGPIMWVVGIIDAIETRRSARRREQRMEQGDW